MNILITVCARGGSKGIPGKNIKILNGKPLIYYTIQLATAFKKKIVGTDIYLSTDSEEIKETVKGLNFPDVNLNYRRPEKLATDNVGKISVIKDLLSYAEDEGKLYDYVIDLDVTSPLRSLEDLEAAFEKLRSTPEAIDIFSVNHANRNPYFNMVEKKVNSPFVKLCKEGSFLTRQSAPEVYDVNASFYIYKKSFFQRDFKSPMTDTTLVYVMPHICFDLDHQVDFEFMSFLMEHEKLEFEFLR